MSPLELVVLASYFVTLAILAAFGFHRSLIVYLYYRHRDRKPFPQPLPATLPRVTVQLPVYNEVYVVERLLDSVARIRYPRELLEIQVLDDSSDETAELARAGVERLRARGFDAHYLRRGCRDGFKAGALAAGLRRATGEFVLIFDADFIAPPEMLEATLGHFRDPRVGMVQARWGHVNRDYSLLTEVQSILLDAHFVLEHGGRSRGGRFFNFNGTAGVWRRAAIEDAGGWQRDTLTEDLDLSYRAQLRGWRFVFLPDVVAPAELPVEMNAFKSQQQRWAKGGVQTCLKLLPRVLAAALPLAVKAEAAFHLASGFAYPLMVLLSLLTLPALAIRYETGWYALLAIDLPLLLGATASVSSFYLASQREVHGPGAWARAGYLAAVLAVGIGLAASNARAVLEALLLGPGEFARTPKLRVESPRDDWRARRYRSGAAAVPFAELLLASYFAFAAWYAASRGIWGTLPFLLLFLAGFLYTGLLSLFQDGGRPGGTMGPAWTSPAARA